MQEEAELVAIIGKPCRNVSEEDALDYVFGYTCGNDVSARDWQASDPTFWRAKASDTFSPIGPYIVTDLDPNELEIFARVNGKQVQHCLTSNMVHDTAACISYISQSVTLGPGDIIYTGHGWDTGRPPGGRRGGHRDPRDRRADQPGDGGVTRGAT